MDRPYKIKRPAGVDKFILEHADRAYLIFDKKNDSVFCTIRNKTIKCSSKQFAHNRKEHCHRCSKVCINAVPKESRYGRKSLTERSRILWFAKTENVVYAQLDEYMIDYCNEQPEIKYNPVQQYKFSESECIRYEKAYPNYFGGNGPWQQRSSFRLPRPVGIPYYYTGSPFEKTLLYTGNIKKINAGPLIYADTYGLAKLVGLNPYSYLHILHQWCTYSSIELLYKAGLTNIVKDRAEEKGCRAINWRANSLRRILKSTPAEIKQLQAVNPTIEGFGLYKKAKGIFDGMRPEFIPLIDEYRAIERLEKMSEQINIQKAMEYMFEQEVRLGDYEDHLRLLAETGQRRNNRNLFPEDFAAQHEFLTLLHADRNNPTTTELMKAAFKKVEYLSYSFDDLTISPAKSPSDLAKESSYLHHCVKTYSERVAGGRAYIFFIRKKDNPEMPYYTLQLSPDFEVVQCRGDHNRDMTENVKQFVQKWTVFISKQIKKKGAA